MPNASGCGRRSSRSCASRWRDDFFKSHSEAFFRALSAELSADEYQSRRRFQELAQSHDPARFLAQEEKLARHWLANVQTRQLAGTAFSDLRDDDPRLLEAALDNLARIDLVGILERQADTLRLLAGMTGWGPLGSLPHLNRTPRSARPAVDADSLDILRSWNELDLRLYAEARRLLDERLATLPPSDDTTRFAQPVGASGFTPDQPLHGFGWHEREHHQGRWLCWNSAPTATLSLRAATARPALFRCLLSHVFNEEALSRLDITLNARPLALRKRAVEDGILLESDIPPAAWTADPHRAVLTFQCPVMGRPRAFDPSAADPRDLGFALAWLNLD
jgi:hypothetical protein